MESGATDERADARHDADRSCSEPAARRVPHVSATRAVPARGWASQPGAGRRARAQRARRGAEDEPRAQAPPAQHGGHRAPRTGRLSPRAHQPACGDSGAGTNAAAAATVAAKTADRGMLESVSLWRPAGVFVCKRKWFFHPITEVFFHPILASSSKNKSRDRSRSTAVARPRRRTACGIARGLGAPRMPAGKPSTPRLSATPQVFLPKGSPGTGRTSVAHSAYTPSPPPTQRPLSAGTPRQGRGDGAGLGAKPAARPGSARPRDPRPWSGRKKPDPAHAGRAELAKFTQLTAGDSHPDKPAGQAQRGPCTNGRRPAAGQGGHGTLQGGARRRAPSARRPGGQSQVDVRRNWSVGEPPQCRRRHLPYQQPPGHLLPIRCSPRR